MPPALLEHVSTSDVPGDGSRQLDESRRPRKTLATFPAGDHPRSPQARPKPDKKSWDYIWRSAVGGGLAGCTAKTFVAPLDRVKILFQASNPHFRKYTGSWFGVVTAMKDIYKEDGTRGLFRGHSATLLRIFPYASIKFLAYEQYRALLIRNPQQETVIRRYLAGSAAGITSVFFVYPLDVIRVRLAFQTKRDAQSTIPGTCRRIFNEAAPKYKPLGAGSASAVTSAAGAAIDAVTPRGGIANFYRGFSATILGMFPYAGMGFLTHDTVTDLFHHPTISKWSVQALQPRSQAPEPESKEYHASRGRNPLRVWAELTAGGIAGMISQTASYPLEVIRRRMQVGGAVGDGRRLRIGETARMIFAERGVMGFWVGLTIGYVKVIPLSGISFLVYERCKIYLNF